MCLWLMVVRGAVVHGVLTHTHTHKMYFLYLYYSYYAQTSLPSLRDCGAFVGVLLSLEP
jgi:hypothetical protein